MKKRISNLLYNRAEMDADIFIKKFYRVNKYNKIKKYFITYKICSLLNKYNSFIGINAKLGKNIVFPHGLNGIFISNGAEIGDNCVIFHQVTIGSNNLEGSKRNGSPKIGNNVYIGAGAKIIGNVKVGDNVRIGANCVVSKDVEANSTIVLGETKIIKHNKELKNEFIAWKNKGE